MSLAAVNWDFLSGLAGSDPELHALFRSVLGTALLLSLAGLGGLLAGLVQGGLLIPFLDRKRRLFQTLPVLNCGLYMLIRTFVLEDTGSEPEFLSQLLIGLPLAAFSGVLAAAFLVPFEVLASGGPAVGTRPTAPQRLASVESWWAAYARGFSAPGRAFGICAATHDCGGTVLFRCC
ncbi:MAG UNVERIFIED_CONTAM: hypothetical protein LVR18_07535 [Planctomycetaceae bacterium]|jgi:hypothetical protein